MYFLSNPPYKGYQSTLNWDADDEIYYGKIYGITDGVSYHSDSIEGMQKVFEEAVDDYIETCHKVNKVPQLPKKDK